MKRGLFLLAMAAMLANDVSATVVYTFTGTTPGQPFRDDTFLIGRDETWTATFLVDETAPGPEEFVGAATNGQVVFEGGYSASMTVGEEATVLMLNDAPGTRNLFDVVSIMSPIGIFQMVTADSSVFADNNSLLATPQIIPSSIAGDGVFWTQLFVPIGYGYSVHDATNVVLEITAVPVPATVGLTTIAFVGLGCSRRKVAQA